MPKVILFELNEVPRRLFELAAASRPRSTVATLWRRARRYETVSQDEGHLSPWITWPTVHRGVTNAHHFIHDFGQYTAAADAEYPPVWRLLAESGEGLRVGVFGSLHSFPPPPSFAGYAFYVPDVFASEPRCHPAQLEAFQDLTLRMARESARNVASAVPWRRAVRVASQFPQLGIRPGTLAGLAGQLARERVQKSRVVRRRSWQALLAFDVFMRQLRRTQPEFATFFTNHVASSMHRYWAAAFPEDYDAQAYDGKWVATYKDEIEFAMSKADAMLGRLMAFVDRHPQYVLIVASSMGQAATTSHPVETQLHVGEPAVFLSLLGVPPEGFDVRPAMFPQFNVAVEERWRAVTRQRLSSLRVNGMPVTSRESGDGFISIDFGQANLADPVIESDGHTVPLAASGLRNVEITDKSGTSAYHVREGVLLIFGSEIPGGDFGSIETTDIAPSILRNFGVPVPSYMSKADLLAPHPTAGGLATDGLAL